MFKIAFSLSLAAFAFSAEVVNESNPVKENPIVLDINNYSELVFDQEQDKYISDKPWFVKFFAPWCGHCKRLAPTWEDLYSNNKDKVNVAHVDCTSEFGKPLCSQFEIRGYPTLYYFPAEEDKQGTFLKYKDQRSLEALESFVNGGYLNYDDSEDLPKQLEGMEYVAKQVDSFVKDSKREIDHIFRHFEMDKAVPAPWRYFLVCCIIAGPVFLVCVLLCCFADPVEDVTIPKKVAAAERKREKVE